jgi:LPXTG-motif cell wall-anchored protein
MRDLRTFLLVLCTALACAVFVPGAKASDHPTSHSVALIAAAYAQVPATPNDSSATNAQADQPSQANMDTAAPEDSPQRASTDQSQATPSQPASSTDQSQAQSQATPSTSPDDSDKQLPKTASSTPLIGLIGILSLATAFGLRQFAKRVS